MAEVQNVQKYVATPELLLLEGGWVGVLRNTDAIHNMPHMGLQVMTWIKPSVCLPRLREAAEMPWELGLCQIRLQIHKTSLDEPHPPAHHPSRPCQRNGEERSYPTAAYGEAPCLRLRATHPDWKPPLQEPSGGPHTNYTCI